METLIKCTSCRQLNRVLTKEVQYLARCGSCGAPLSPKAEISSGSSMIELPNKLDHYKSQQEILDLALNRMDFIENSFSKFCLKRIALLRPHIENRVNNESVWANPPRQRSKIKKSLDNFLSNINYTKICRLMNYEFGSLVVYKINDRQALKQRIGQPLEFFFSLPKSREEVMTLNAELKKQKDLLNFELQKIREEGYGGFFSSKPSRSQYEKKIQKIENSIENIRWLQHQAPSQYEKDEEYLFHICSHILKYSNEISNLDRLIKNIRSEIHAKKVAKRTEAKLALGAAAEGKVRQESKNFRTKMARNTTCPYCTKSLDGTAHLDHIYPVSRGGLNIFENLVYCCSTCNSKKSDKSLYQFCRENELSLTLVIERLVKLGKHI